MNECEKCRADKTVCQYCIYKDKNSSIEKQDNDNIIYFNNIKDDNTSKRFVHLVKKYILNILLFQEKIIKL